MKLEHFRAPLFLPFVVVVFDATDLPNRELAKTFRLKKARSNSKSSHPERNEVTIAESNTWKAIGDWNYSLWHDPRTRPAVWKIAQRYQVLTFMVGDTNDAQSIHLFEKGKLVRELIIEDTLGGGAQRTVIDHGPKLKGESDNPCSGPELVDCVYGIARANGFDPSTAHRATRWTSTDDRSTFDIATTESKLAETSWQAYRPDNEQQGR